MARPEKRPNGPAHLPICGLLVGSPLLLWCVYVSVFGFTWSLRASRAGHFFVPRSQVSVCNGDFASKVALRLYTGGNINRGGSEEEE